MQRKTKDHLNLLCDIGELADLVSGSEDIFTFLQHSVEMVQRHLHADAASIYLYDELSAELILFATIGLNKDAIGKIRMKIGEGLVGTTIEKRKPVCEDRASLNPRFKFFKEADEESFESFMSVPIQRGEVKIGVLVVQHKKTGYFIKEDLNALRAAASQLAGSIESAKLMMELHKETHSDVEEINLNALRIIKGETASPGYALAPVTIFRKTRKTFLIKDKPDEPEYTQADFEKAIIDTSNQLKEMESGFAERLPESASLIFTAHFMILKDPSFTKKMSAEISDGVNPPDAVRKIANQYIKIFSSSPHAYMKEKANDVSDLSRRILRNLTIGKKNEPAILQKSIVISKEIFPSDILKLSSEEVQGIILVGGGLTSHISILARSLNLPLIITNKSELLSLPPGTSALLDGDTGNIFIDPNDEILSKHEERLKTKKTIELLKTEMMPESVTSDGCRIKLMANINLLAEIKLALDLKAEGVGLYRTEFPFLVRANFPTEEEQYFVYKKLLDDMGDRPVTIRTLDAGGDKILAYTDMADEDNPALGLRSIRFSLKLREIFIQQLRAILRAGAYKKELRIMFPMISSLDEFFEAKNILLECIKALEDENIIHNNSPLIGMMVELPAVLETIDEFAEATDFFSIGTNDFVQYMLAVDRGNKRVAEYFRPHHPSVLKALKKIADAGLKAGIEVSVCGEMAHERKYIPFLIGIGIYNLSINAQELPAVQKQIAAIRIEDARKHADELLGKSTIKDTQEIIDKFCEYPIENP